MKTLTKYLSKQISLTFIAITLVFTIVMVGGTFLASLNKAYDIGIPVEIVIELSLLRLIYDFEILLLVSLFLSILLTLTRLYQENEIAVIIASGISEWQLIKMIAPIILGVTFLVGFFSLILIPWAHQESEILLNKHKDKPIIKVGKFQEFDNIMLFVGKISEDNKMQNIFSQIQIKKGEKVFIIAEKGNSYTEKSTGNIYLQLQNGKRYHGFNSKNTQQHIISFKNYKVRLFENTQNNLSLNKLRARDNLALLRSNTNENKAEFESRLSRPISVLLLSILAILLSKTSPREAKGLSVFKGILVLTLYNNLLALGRGMLDKGEIPLIIGLWWVHLLLITLIFVIYYYRYYLDFSKLPQLLTKRHISHLFFKKGDSNVKQTQ